MATQKTCASSCNRWSRRPFASISWTIAAMPFLGRTKAMPIVCVCYSPMVLRRTWWSLWMAPRPWYSLSRWSI